MAMQDWIHKYPGVQRLLQQCDEELDGAPPDTPHVPRTRPSYYTLDGQTPIPCASLLIWGIWFAQAERHVRDTWLAGDVRVSTVFLGLDHNWSHEGPPLLFETMVFGREAWEGCCQRYATWSEAEAGHEAVIAQIRAGVTPEEND